jgi:hypothetical protein
MSVAPSSSASAATARRKWRTMNEPIPLTISPERALEILLRAKPLNEIKPEKIQAISKLMATGKFPTRLPIRFDRHGNLLDGHHRLAAVIESGKTIEFSVEYDSSPIDARRESVA